MHRDPTPQPAVSALLWCAASVACAALAAGCGGDADAAPAETPEQRAAALAKVDAEFPPPGNNAERDLLVSSGERAFKAMRCDTCHKPGDTSLGPIVLPAPTSDHVALADGRLEPRDRLYLYRSIHEPKRDVTDGYASKMPAYPQMTSDQTRALLVYLATK